MANIIAIEKKVFRYIKSKTVCGCDNCAFGLGRKMSYMCEAAEHVSGCLDDEYHVWVREFSDIAAVQKEFDCEGEV